ncbi:amino acid ABC transporter ATP-binding protein [Fusobacterium ulcerans]|nr:amino acid ABC transporter ATP-binding protein [Fusobacterium ulcerans]MCB8649429.1 amino acid ABC transporter ATP-binding protein [Fusobacterium ulcerans]HJH06350.1 amino acid ABC transporter ATP-binding protein [Fusobacterium ulcerans]
MIKVNDLSKQYLEGDVILKGVNLDIEKGEVVSIIGPSGGGKSTLLRCLIGLEEIDSGNIEVPDKKKMGMVFQSFNLFPHKTAIQNIMESLIVVDKMDKSEAKKIAYDLLEKVGLKDRADFYPKALSGGQKQRVAIARALARNPEVLLFDEPTSALDPDMVKEVLNVIEQLRESSNITMVIVSHEIDFVNQISDRIVVMENGNIKNIIVNKKKRQVS